MAVGKWQVFEITQRGRNYFVTGRLLDTNRPPLIDNIEFETYVSYDREVAQGVADWLNRRDEQEAV